MGLGTVLAVLLASCSGGSPASAAAAIGRGEAALESRDYPAAYDAFEEALALDPGSALAIGGRGCAAASLGPDHWDQARDDLDRAIELDETLAAAFDCRASLRRMVPDEDGRPDLRGALEDARTATSLAPDVGSFHVTLGNVLDDLGRTDEALAAYDTAIELEPDMAYAYRNRSLARIRSGDSAGARDDLDRALELDPEYAEAYVDRAFEAVFGGDCDAALADADRALELDERSANGHAIRALCADDPDDALDEAEAAIELGRRDCWMYTVVGLIQAERGEPAEAREALERALAIAPDDATADDVRQLIAELPEP